jgi:hypothetical protein
MANVRAFRAGNWSDTNTTTSPWATGGVLYAPNSSDDVYTNGFTITVDNSPTVISITNTSATSRVWKDGATTTAAAGGGFVLANGVTLTATTASLTTVGANFLTLSGTNSASFVGNITGNPSFSYSVVNTSSGTLNFTGFTEATGSGGGTFRNQVGGSLIINGGVISSASSVAIYQDAGGNTTLNGYCTSNGVSAVNNNGVGQVTIVGTMTASNGGGNAVRSTNTSSLVRASGSFICAADGTMAVAAIKMILNTTPTMAKTRYALNGTSTYADMFTADNGLTQAAPADVRSGTVYADGNLTGTCAVPAAGSVALGVPVDATTGTAVLTPEAVWGAATRTLTTSSGPTAVQIRQEMDSNSTKLANLDTTVSSRLAPSGTLATVTTLTNAPTVPTAAAIATQVRSELTTELARLDTNVGSRAASGTLASDVTAIKAKTDALVTDRLAQVSTVSTTGAQLAAALS